MNGKKRTEEVMEKKTNITEVRFSTTLVTK